MNSREARTVLAAVVMIICVLYSNVASAHHGRSGYSNTKITVKGTVTELRWKNPHVFVIFDVKDENGEVSSWIGEMSSTSTMIAAGMTKSSLKTGDEITVAGTPAQGGGHVLVDSILRPDGKPVVGGAGGRFTEQTRETP